jgi:hypothetical protein
MYALVAALSTCVLSLGAAAVATGTPGNGNGSGSTATAGPGNSSQGCDGTHNSDTGHGANQGGPYDNTCDGSPSGNGNGNGQATGKPCAGCVGNADDKNPGYNNGKGQMPNGSDHNAGYECDRNHGIGRSNPAHTGCTTETVTPPPSTCPNGQPMPPSGKCGEESGQTCPNGQPMPPSGNCGNNETPPPTTTSNNTPETPQQAVLGTRESSPEATTAPANTPAQEVLGARAGGTTPSSTSAPSTAAGAPVTAQRTRTAAANRQLPFTGTDLIAVLLAGALMLMAGFGLRHLAAHRA